MSEKVVSGHTLQEYDQELSELNGLILQAAGKARSQLRQALQALEEEDAALAQDVILRDKEIDALDREVEEKVFLLIARQQPVAKDLRDLLAADRMMVDIERIGDETRRLAKTTLFFYDGDDGNPPNYSLLSDISRLAAFVDRMLVAAIESFEREDAEIALDILRWDTQLDEEMKAALRRLSTYLLDDARRVGQIVEIALCLRGVERIGRHAAHIARQVIFLITGEDVRHKDLQEAEHVVKSYQGKR